MSMSKPERPPFIVSSADVEETRHAYPKSEEQMAPSRAVGAHAGLLRIGLHLMRVGPGQRTSYPHAEETRSSSSTSSRASSTRGSTATSTG
jgi:uncharacterized cupin superfamily protein